MNSTCAYCGKPHGKRVSEVNRAERAGLRLFCSRVCFGMDRRLNRSLEEKRRIKQAYDERYRERLAEEIAAKKRAYHQRVYTPEKGREFRKHQTFDHSAYCRRYYADPAKKAEKVQYDIQRRGQEYADFAESWRVLIELERELRKMVPDKYERQKNRGYFLKINERKRHDRQDRRTA